MPLPVAGGQSASPRTLSFSTLRALDDLVALNLSDEGPSRQDETTNGGLRELFVTKSSLTPD